MSERPRSAVREPWTLTGSLAAAISPGDDLDGLLLLQEIAGFALVIAVELRLPPLPVGEHVLTLHEPHIIDGVPGFSLGVIHDNTWHITVRP